MSILVRMLGCLLRSQEIASAGAVECYGQLQGSDVEGSWAGKGPQRNHSHSPTPGSSCNAADSILALSLDFKHAITSPQLESCAKCSETFSPLKPQASFLFQCLAWPATREVHDATLESFHCTRRCHLAAANTKERHAHNVCPSAVSLRWKMRLIGWDCQLSFGVELALAALEGLPAWTWHSARGSAGCMSGRRGLDIPIPVFQQKLLPTKF